MNLLTNQATVLVIGGHGYIGRHIVKHLDRLGANTIVGTRKPNRVLKQTERNIRLHEITQDKHWLNAVEGADVVVNAVGILRERMNEGYDCVHHTAVKALADACQTSGARFIQISALGLNSNAHSRFLKSKRDGEAALQRCNADWYIVRPSLVDGDGGFGARWFRRAANWPVHITPACAKGTLAPIDIDDLGEAVARLALNKIRPSSRADREYDLGGDEHFTLNGYLDALANKPALMKFTVPAPIARLAAHLCDLLHVTPYSYGHHELLKHDNVPRINRLRELLGRPATPIGRPNNDAEQLQPALG